MGAPKWGRLARGAIVPSWCDREWQPVCQSLFAGLNDRRRLLFRGSARPFSVLSCALPLASLEAGGKPFSFLDRHRMRQDYPLNLSISLSGGEETNQDAPSNGE